MWGRSKQHRALQEIEAVCRRAAAGDLSARILHVKSFGEHAPTLNAVNRLLDLTDAYVRESGATLTAAARSQYHRPFLLTGMLGHFRRGAEIINRARDAMRHRANETSALGDELSGLIAAASAGDLGREVALEGKDGVMHQIAAGINALLTTTRQAIQDVATVIGALAQGRLQDGMAGQYQGVFGRLQQDTDRTLDTLRGIVGRLGSASEQMSSAASEISGGSRDLAVRTESQASTLQETAAAMQQVADTVRRNAEMAQAANGLAVAARDQAEKGGAIVGEAVGAVSRIEESAQKISEIVGLIDEIAFQTNLLALNASVEAARAGEAGKGFAVVAQEVRALAQRSANASKDIKTLIGESNAQVKTGAALVNQAGAALTEIVGASRKLADIVTEIAAASQEQSGGLDDINRAVGNLDEMTQRNGALVEETSAAAHGLAEQAHQLAEIVGFFRVGSGAPQAAPAHG